MNNLEKLILAIKKINSNAEFEATDVDNIIWKNGTTPISKENIEAQYATIEAEETSKIAKKEEAKAKLVELGLTEEHLKALGL